jgi:hypothetical protein
VLGVVLLIVVATACTWPAEGWDAARTGFNPLELTLTTSNVGSLTRVWGTDTGATAMTPAVVGSRVFVPAGDAVEAFDTATGAVDWITHNHDTSLPPAQVVGPLSAVGDKVLAPVNWDDDAGGVFTFDDTTGARSGSGSVHHVVLGSVATRNDATAVVSMSFIPVNDRYFFLDYGTYSTVLDTAGSVTSPSIIGRSVLVGVDNRIKSFSLDTCVPDPALPPQFPSCAPQWTATVPAAPRDPVGIGTSEAAIGLANGDVAVLDLGTGALEWTAHTGSTAATAPAVANGQLYVGAGDGDVDAFSATGCGESTCAPEWSGATASGAAVSHQPAVGNNVVYVGTSTGAVYAFAAGGCGTSACASLWNGAVNPSGPAAPVWGPVVASGTVYASAGSTLAAFRLP